MAGGSRSALIIACDDYVDPEMRRLRSPAADARALAEVLGNPEIGGFEVETVLNHQAHELLSAVDYFFAKRSPDDLLLLHYSGHGIKDQDGELYLAAPNTVPGMLGSTAVPAGFVSKCMTRSRSKRVVLLLDCCFAGAFARGMPTRSTLEVGVGEHFSVPGRLDGRGRAVITASNAMQYAFEEGELTDNPEVSPSFFSGAVVEGLATGAADHDRDGFIGLGELYEYVYGKVVAATPNQTPERWFFGLEGELHIARSIRPVDAPTALPADLGAAVNSVYEVLRKAAAEQLALILGGEDQELALAAELALTRLADDDNAIVAAAAGAALSSAQAGRRLTPRQLEPAPPPAPAVAPPLLARTIRDTRRLDIGQEYSIGRDSRSDIPLADPRVSWQHAVLRTEGPTWVLEDRSSRNGTYLGVERISRLEITGPYVVRFASPDDGPVIRFELPVAQPSPEFAMPSAEDTTFLPGVIREPTSGLRIPTKVISIGRRPDNDIVLPDLSVSMQHAELRISAVGSYSVIDLGSDNGTFVNGTRVNQAELRESDLIAVGSVTFRLVGGELNEYTDDGRGTFEANGLQVVVGDGGRQKVLIEGITFPLPARSMMAVIGPAGSGKSTLLNALTGKRPASTGSVYYDSRDLYENYDELKHRIGLVPQQSVIHNQLTPRTALGYAATLRFPADVSEAELSHRVEEVLDQLSMTQHANTKIERLSGGQKKRVNIGVELLTRPSLLFLDEPTSPLDPHLKMDMFRQMRAIANPNAQEGQSVVVFTNDVELRLLNLCDRILVLRPGGKMTYFGPPKEGLKFFGKEDWADVFEAFADDPMRDWGAEFRSSADYAKYIAAPMSAHMGRPPVTHEVEDVPQLRPRNGDRHLLLLARRYTRVIRADRGYVTFATVLPLFLGLIVRLIPAPLGLGGGPPVNRVAQTLLLFLVMSAVLCGTLNSIREFIREREIYERERMTGLSAGAYLLSKVLVLGSICVLQAVLIVLVGLAGRRLPPHGALTGLPFLEILIAVSVLCVASMIVGLALSTLSTRRDQALPALVVIVITQAVLSGGVFPVTGVAAWLSDIAPARWGLASLAATIDLNQIDSPESQHDAMWAHTAGHWLLAMGAMVLLTVAFALISRARLGALGPGRRSS